jgi:hypothetical protein
MAGDQTEEIAAIAVIAGIAEHRFFLKSRIPAVFAFAG